MKLYHFRLKLQSSSNDANVEIKFNYEEHLAAANHPYRKFMYVFSVHEFSIGHERQHYNEVIEKCKNDLTSTHICYDWAQNVSAPYLP